MTTAKSPTPLLTKARLAIEIATLMLGDGATSQNVEDQSVALMFAPLEELQKMLKRFAAIALRRSKVRKKR